MEIGVGSVIARRYRLTRQIGKGGMGSVFEAVEERTNDRVALKIMASSRSAEDDDLKIARFEREALAIGKLDTPHVVRVFDAGVDDVTRDPFIAMELLEGEDVSHLLKRLGPLRPELALAIVAQACAGLAKAHDAGVIHRDIKPGNLFLHRQKDGSHVVKVLDFGIAKVTKIDDAISSELGTITETGTLIGSPYYMSPEQAKGLKTVDRRADVWSLGVVLYKCLSGRTPFDGHSTLGQVILAVCGEDAGSVQVHAPWVPPVVSEVIRHALRRNVNERYQSALDLLASLSALLPNGPRITDDMIQPLPEDVRAQIAPPATGYPESTPVALNLPAPSLSGSMSRASVALESSASAATRPKSSSRALTIAILALVVLASVGATLILLAMRRATLPDDTAAARHPPASASALVSASASVPSATPSASSASASVATSVAPPPKHVSTTRVVKTGPRATATATGSGPGRLQGGVGSDVPF